MVRVAGAVGWVHVSLAAWTMARLSFSGSWDEAVASWWVVIVVLALLVWLLALAKSMGFIRPGLQQLSTKGLATSK